MSDQKRPENADMATTRDEYPSGLRVLMQNESVGYMIDALMDIHSDVIQLRPALTERQCRGLKPLR